MRDIPQEIINALESQSFRPLFLVSIYFDTPLHFSSAFGSTTVGGIEYIGAGNLGSISSFKENTDLDPQQLEITLAGISDDALTVIGGTNYINKEVRIRVAMLDQEGGIIGNTTMTYFVGKTDEVKFVYGSNSQIIVIARDRLSDWARTKVERNTNADQQAKYPGDKGFEFVAQIADKKIIWPAGEFFE